MGRPAASSLRKSLKLAYANGALWGGGSGLASVSLIAYFARELHAGGTAIAWILAAPSLAGLLRLGTPWWLHRVASRRRFCVAMFLASAATLAALPFVAAPGRFGDSAWSLAALGSAWSVAQTLEFIGVVALWSWFGDLVPAAVRGRFVGRREAWLTAGLVAGGFAAAAITWAWQRHCTAIGRPELLWKSYAACASFGAALSALATLPLARVAEPRAASRSTRNSGTSPLPRLGDLVRPLVDPRFRRLMAFGVCFSVANGLVQSPRQIFLASVLRLELAEKRSLDAASRGVQILLMPWLGRLVDRRGNVRLLVVSWSIVSLALVFFLIATPATWWLIIGAYVCWIAYAGLNVTLPNLMLSLSPRESTASYAAAWFAWTQLAYSLSILGGGYLFDRLAAMESPAGSLPATGGWLDRFGILFAASGALMLVGVGLAARVPEPTDEEAA
ncbi:MFS transporter [Lacipirellula sp.]|uniref:MFS transporter n=1 Tax=Lacipirellula sp. TaxID=2691419 RepID=UPI003D0EA100